MPYKLFITPKASADIELAAAWYDKKRPQLGDIFLLAVQDVFASIKRQPEMYAFAIDDIRRSIFSRFPYKVMYRLRGDSIQILAITHHKQHPDSWLTRIDSDAD